MATMKHQFRIMRQHDNSFRVEVRSFNPLHWLCLTGFPWWDTGSYLCFSLVEAQHAVEQAKRSLEVAPVEVERY